MKIKFLILFVLAVLFGTVANAAEKDNIGVAAAAGGNAAGASKKEKEVAPVNFSDSGTWVGVIEDIQDIDNSKWAEFQTKWKLPNVGRTVGLAIGYNVALATGQALQVYTWANMLDRRISGHSRLRNDPRTFQIFFKQDNGTMQSVVVHDQQMWEVGDKVKIVSDGVKTTVETIEMGELSKYAAAKRAERK